MNEQAGLVWLRCTARVWFPQNSSFERGFIISTAFFKATWIWVSLEKLSRTEVQNNSSWLVVSFELGIPVFIWAHTKTYESVITFYLQV